MKKTLYPIFFIFLWIFSFLVCDIYVSQEEKIFRSKTIPMDYVFSYTQPHEEVYLHTAKDATIHGLYFPSRSSSPKGVILYFHGRAWNLGGKKRAGFPEDFTKRGYDLFVIDYRGFGKSRGPRSEAAIHHDANCAYEYLLQKYPERQITVYGMSFGTGVATRVAARHNPKQLILECPYFSMLDMAYRAAPHLPNWITSLVLKYHLRTDCHIENVTCPVHIFHGTKDKLIPHYSSQRLIKKVKSRARLISIDDGDHDHLPTFTTYQQELESLLR